MTERESASRYYVLPVDLLERDDINAQEKLVLAVVHSLTGQKGYCWASNERLSKYLGISSERTRKVLAGLKRKGLLEIQVIRDEGKRVIERRLKTTGPLWSKIAGPPAKNDHTPPAKNDQYNNLYKNNLVNKIPPDGGSVPDTPSKPTEERIPVEPRDPATGEKLPPVGTISTSELDKLRALFTREDGGSAALQLRYWAQQIYLAERKPKDVYRTILKWRQLARKRGERWYQDEREHGYFPQWWIEKQSKKLKEELDG